MATTQVKASSNGHGLVMPDGNIMPSSIFVEVGGAKIEAPGVPVKAGTGFRYEAAADATLNSAQAEDALRNMVVSYEGTPLNAAAVTVSKVSARSKGGNLTTLRTLTIHLGESAIAYNLQVRATAVTRKVNGDDTPVVNLRVKAFRQSTGGGRQFAPIGTVSGDLSL